MVEYEKDEIPFLIETEYGSRFNAMEIESIRVNTDIDPAVFVMPDSEEKK
jgi:hypothetical protein